MLTTWSHAAIALLTAERDDMPGLTDWVDSSPLASDFVVHPAIYKFFESPYVMLVLEGYWISELERPVKVKEIYPVAATIFFH